ncbi:unnamed protein product [Protopolystoma xenopodis]|uniref:Uncharacterized protein n=1 Tax=Protopolystoma xenopodis TaxID=117903 RepID=A0A448XNI6_9PLAT|nr:unnamed protein product [Protopolystoma xenopodis]
MWCGSFFTISSYFLPKYEKSWTNLRRENRVYSYEVQMDILAAQREREASLRQKSAISAAGGLRPILEQIGDRLTQTQPLIVERFSKPVPDFYAPTQRGGHMRAIKGLRQCGK